MRKREQKRLSKIEKQYKPYKIQPATSVSASEIKEAQTSVQSKASSQAILKNDHKTVNFTPTSNRKSLRMKKT